MTENENNCSCPENPLLPRLCKVTKIINETPDVKTFHIQTQDGKKPFDPKPGQLMMLSILGVGEAMFSITAQGDNHIEAAVKKVGELTEAMHEMSEGDEIGVRGPYGNGFPIEQLTGYNLLLIGGGIGVAPLRSLMQWCQENRKQVGQIDLVYGSRTPDDIVFKNDLLENWKKMANTTMLLTTDTSDETWNGNIGFVSDYLEKLAITAKNRKAILCGPPIMMNLCTQTLVNKGFYKQNIILTLEKRMKCGIGKCGRCNIGSKLVCVDGPVFTLAEFACRT